MKSILLTFLLTLSYAVHAFDDKHLDAHIHGLVEMSLIAEANIVEVHITSPLMNLVGFEHNARTEAEKKALHNMAAVFNTPQKWLYFNEVNCQLVQQSVSHGDEHHDHDMNESQHAELEANYRFNCKPGLSDSVTVSLQDFFPAIESISLSWLVGAASGITNLHHGERDVHFSH